MEFFSVPKQESKKKPKPKPKPGPDDPIVPPIPPPPPPLTIFNTITDGFEVVANPDYSDWPRNISISVAYADGTKNPKWEKFDFQFKDLQTSFEGIESFEVNKNQILFSGCGPDLALSILGFDQNRELDVIITPEKDVSNA